MWLARMVMLRTWLLSVVGSGPAYVRAVLFSLDNVFAVGLFVAACNALIAHKCAVILLHGPLRVVSVVLLVPFLFALDILTLLFLHRGLASKSRGLQVFAGLICVAVISSSATFISSYLETNAELNWGRSLEVFAW